MAALPEDCSRAVTPVGSPRTRRIVESIGIVGVIGSLIFVGIEIRQNSIATRTSTDAAIADAYLQLNLALATDPDLACVFATQTDNPATASASDREQMLGYWRGLFQIWSNVHRQHLNGTVDPMIYASVEREIRSYAGQLPVGASTNRIEARRRMMFWAWQSEKFQFSEDFSTFVDGLINANTKPPQAEDQTVMQGASTDGMPQPGQVTASPCRG